MITRNAEYIHAKREIDEMRASADDPEYELLGAHGDDILTECLIITHPNRVSQDN